MLDDAALALEEIEPKDNEVLGARVNLCMAEKMKPLPSPILSEWPRSLARKGDNR